VDDESNICHVSLSSNPICSSFRFLSLLYGWLIDLGASPCEFCASDSGACLTFVPCHPCGIY
jgi:hypothetical protein